MQSGEIYEVRVSRWLLLLLIVVGVLFALVGLDLLVWRRVLTAEGSGAVRTLFAIVAIGLASLIALTQLRYLVRPPVMLRASREGVAFGTGFGYHPHLIPLKHLRHVGVFRAESSLEVAGRRRIVEGGIELEFESSPDIPASLATSAGIGYAQHHLRLQRMYMNCAPTEAVAGIQRATGRD